MIVRQMTQTECRKFLEHASIGRLGCSLDEQPYIVPVYLAYDADNVYIFSTFGQKIRWMRANPKVCIQIDEITDDSEWTSVIANGRYQELPEPQYATECARARNLLEKRYRWWLNALAERRTEVKDNMIAPLFFRLHVDSITGLCASPEDKIAGAPAPHA